jgi:hypothetical protein
MKDSIGLDPTKAIGSEEYQNRVTLELISCLQLHHTTLLIMENATPRNSEYTGVPELADQT